MTEKLQSVIRDVSIASLDFSDAIDLESFLADFRLHWILERMGK
jgi:hypothetical protein